MESMMNGGIVNGSINNGGNADKAYSPLRRVGSTITTSTMSANNPAVNGSNGTGMGIVNGGGGINNCLPDIHN